MFKVHPILDKLFHHLVAQKQGCNYSLPDEPFPYLMTKILILYCFIKIGWVFFNMQERAERAAHFVRWGDTRFARMGDVHCVHLGGTHFVSLGGFLPI